MYIVGSLSRLCLFTNPKFLFSYNSIRIDFQMAANTVSLSISSSTVASPKTLHSLQTRGLIPPPTISFPKSLPLSSTTVSISRSRVRAGPSQLMNEPANAMTATPTIVEVDLGNRSYPIYIGAGLLDQSELLQRCPLLSRSLVL